MFIAFYCELWGLEGIRSQKKAANTVLDLSSHALVGEGSPAW